MDDENLLWQRLVNSNRSYIEARTDFLQHAKNRIELLRGALNGTGLEVITAIQLVEALGESERLSLFPQILQKCISQKWGSFARSIVINLPRPWVLEHIEAESKNLLVDHLDYLMMLGLYTALDRALALRLAGLAAASADEDIRDLGVSYLKPNG